MTQTITHHLQKTGIAGKARMIALALMMAVGGAVGAVTAASGAQVVGEVNVNDG